MNPIIDFKLVSYTRTKDKMGQTVLTPSEKSLIGEQKSIFQNEFFKAEQAGLRSQGVVVMSFFDYSGEEILKIGGDEFSIYRTFRVGTDKIELYYGKRVGNGKSSSSN